MKNRQKRQLSDLFRDKRALAAVAVFLLLMGFILYRLLSSLKGNETSAVTGEQNQVNAIVPTAQTDSTTRSKLEMQAEEAQAMALPGNDLPSAVGSAPLQATIPEAADLRTKSTRRYAEVDPYYYNKPVQTELPTLDTLYEPANGRRNRRKPMDEEEEEPAADQQEKARDLKKKLDDRERLLKLLNEYKKDKEARIAHEKEGETPKKVEQPGIVASLNGVERSRNGFYGLYSADEDRSKTQELDAEIGTIQAMIHQDQEIVNGGRLQLRLLEPIQLRGSVIPAGTMIYGLCQFGTERVNVNLLGIQYEDRIYPVKMTAYDMDGLPGIYVPKVNGLQEGKQAYANSVSGIRVGGGYSNSPAAVAGTAVAQAGVSGLRQFLQRKAHIQKAKLKANYYVLLK